MRLELCNALVKRADNTNIIFLTGDLGYMALEPLKEKLDTRFINAGISEQNMVSVAGALAKKGFEVWVYSIAPFLYARAFEQIRNDVIFHNLPVNLIGNGGGFGYGVMGPTHHALEDYGSLLNFENIEIYIPGTNNDIEKIIELAGNSNSPTYTRLGKSEYVDEMNLQQFTQWRQLLTGNNQVVIAVGPLAGHYHVELRNLEQDVIPNLWMISKLPILGDLIPMELLSQIKDAKKIIIAEEHVGNSGVAFEIFKIINNLECGKKEIYHLFAQRHTFLTYGSQNYLRRMSNLDANSLIEVLNK